MCADVCVDVGNWDMQIEFWLYSCKWNISIKGPVNTPFVCGGSLKMKLVVRYDSSQPHH